MKKVLVTGANGFLGQHLCQFLSNDFTVVANGRGKRRIPDTIQVDYIEADLTDKEAVIKMVQDTQPDIIIHTAAMSKPDECFANPEACIAANVTATHNLLRIPVPHFIYTSTDFVFGENGPHAEDDPTGPLNFYGETKLQAEKVVYSAKGLTTIVRPVFIYGKAWDGMRGSFLHWVKTNLEQQKKIKVVTDQQRTPTYAVDICKGIKAIIEKKVGGVFHLAGKDIVSPYQMAVDTANVLGLDASLIEPVTADTFPEPVKRAQRSGLKIDKAVSMLGYDPVTFKEGVKLTFEH